MFGKFEGPLCNYLKIYWGQIDFLEKFEDQNANLKKT